MRLQSYDHTKPSHDDPEVLTLYHKVLPSLASWTTLWIWHKGKGLAELAFFGVAGLGVANSTAHDDKENHSAFCSSSVGSAVRSVS